MSDYRMYEILNGEKILPGTMYCIGQNYAKHAAEMGSAVSENPTVFIKPPAAYAEDFDSIRLPDFSQNVHYEVELVVLIGKDCYEIEESDAYKYIAGYAVGIDLTLRDLQNQAKKEGKPWAVAKGFYRSAPISAFVPQSQFGEEIPFFDLKLKMNGIPRQSGSTKDMERSVANLIKYLASVFTLRRGDVIFTGTPEGVGQVKIGDGIKAELVGYCDLTIGIC